MADTNDASSSDIKSMATIYEALSNIICAYSGRYNELEPFENLLYKQAVSTATRMFGDADYFLGEEELRREQ